MHQSGRSPHVVLVLAFHRLLQLVLLLKADMVMVWGSHLPRCLRIEPGRRLLGLRSLRGTGVVGSLDEALRADHSCLKHRLVEVLCLRITLIRCVLHLLQILLDLIK